MKMRDRHIRDVFRRSVNRVPAYKDFLKKSGQNIETVSAIYDITKIPITSKNNYLREHPFEKLFWDGTLKNTHILTATSGSTGEPFYFGRSRTIDEQSSQIHELFFKTTSLDKEVPTLVIVAFGMGLWIGGLITYQAFEHMGRRGHPISVITPGINKAEILKVLKNIAPHYKQVIIAGYPPFIKDILDEAEEAGMPLPKHRTAIITAAEAFTEHFRDYLAKKAHVANVYTDIMNIYGTAEIGTMAFETPIAVLIRRLAMKKPELFTDLFRDIEKTPTLTQFIPSYVSFEETAQGELLLTGDSATPLIRYAVGDHGGVLSFDEVVKRCRAHGFDLMKEAREAGIDKQTLKLPFVYVYERADLSTTLYGLQIYPESIREALLEKDLTPTVTGRATLVTKFDDAHNQYLEVHVELRKSKTGSTVLAGKIEAEIIKVLKHKNAEYRELASYLGDRAKPRIIFWPHEDPQYFRPDVKQKWVIKAA